MVYISNKFNISVDPQQKEKGEAFWREIDAQKVRQKIGRWASLSLIRDQRDLAMISDSLEADIPMGNEEVALLVSGDYLFVGLCDHPTNTVKWYLFYME